MPKAKTMFPVDESPTKETKKGRYELLTKNGYDLYEVASALQKTIRRNLPREAVFWGLELYPKYVKYAWERLLIISAEDIRDPSAVAATKALYDSYILTGKKRPHRIFLTRAILSLCTYHKNRNADHFQNLNDFLEKDVGGNAKIPAFALDKHTRRGKKMGKTTLDFFRDEQEGLEPLKENEVDVQVYKDLIERLQK